MGAPAARSPLMRMIAARAKVDEALGRALLVAVEHAESASREPSALDHAIDSAYAQLVDACLMEASRQLQEFQEAAHG